MLQLLKWTVGEEELIMSEELIVTMLEALTQMVNGLRDQFPPTYLGQRDWLDTMPHMDEPVALAEEAIEEARTFLEGGG